jgi:aldehyde:ferredoxin oxidoreductase
VIDEDKFAVMVDNFYQLHGWDKTTGWPTKVNLEELDLKDVADELEAAGKLP